MVRKFFVLIPKSKSCIFRKYLAALVQALHLTPARRLRPTMEKVQGLSGAKLQPDSFQVALLHLLQNLGWSNSLQDLATSIQAVDDGQEGVVLNVNKLLCKLVETLAWADDYKLQDMAHRHEMKFVMNYGYGGCVHLQPRVTKHRCIQLSLRVTNSSSQAVVTAEQLNAKVDGLLQCHLPEESCQRCDIRVNRTGSLSIQQGCDPDFLTVVCESPVSFSAPDFNIIFSNSVYRVMTVVSWDTQSRRASVSRERPDGWWWHGVDEGQAPSHKYSAEQVQAFRHLQDVSVMMSVRVGAKRGHVGSDSHACEESQSALSEQVVKGGQTSEVRGHELGSQSVEMDQTDIVVFNPHLTSTQIGGSQFQGETGGKGPQGTCREAAGIGDSSLEVLDTCQGDDNPAPVQDEEKEEETQSQRCVDNVCVCGFVGVLADHLRLSKQCVDALRKEPLLKMKASEAVFIAKASLMLRGPIPMQCPAEGCPGGPHDQLPDACILWWRETGWKLMGWTGSSANADSESVNQKIIKFCYNLRHRNKGNFEQSLAGVQHDGEADGSKQSDTGSTSQSNGRHFCQFCSQESVLVPHLFSEKACLTAYLGQHLPSRVHMYRGKTNLAVFDLGIICKFCPNPACNGDLVREGVKHHVGGACLPFFQTEGQKLFGWNQDLDASCIEIKLRGRRSTLRDCVSKGRDLTAFQQELAQMLQFSCSSCGIQGPLLDCKNHRIYGAGSSSDGRPEWKCSQCSSSDDAHQEMVRHAEERVRELGSPDEHGDTLRQMVIEVEGCQGTRVVYVPASLIPDYEGVDIGDNLNPMGTTVLVPKNPEALAELGDGAAERAHTSKQSLEQVAGFFGRRLFNGPLTETLTVLHRLKLGNIRAARLTMLNNLKKTSKGKIVNRNNPNLAEVTRRNPHYAETLKFCLRDTCCYSTAACERRSEESAARASVSGQVKLKVEITLIDNLARDSPLLRDIILSSSSTAPRPLICFAPTVLNYVKAKLKLLIKHVIAPMYSNWDLQLRFDKLEWTVKLVGYLHCEEFDELNKRIARGEVSSREVAQEIQRHPHILPTTALGVNRLKEDHGMSEDRAQVNIFSNIKKNKHPCESLPH